MKRSAASGFARSAVGAAIGGFVFFAVGCPVSLVVGWQIAFHKSDGREEVLYSTFDPDPQNASFWVVLYDDEDQTTLQQVSGPDFEAPSGERLIPKVETEAALGPWRGPGPPTYRDSTIPGGDHNYQAGGVTFTPNGDTTEAVLILYPRHPQDGWIREYYIYEVDGPRVVLTETRRERVFNEWGIEALAVYAFLLTAAATILGMLAGLAIGPRALADRIRL